MDNRETKSNTPTALITIATSTTPTKPIMTTTPTTMPKPPHTTERYGFWPFNPLHSHHRHYAPTQTGSPPQIQNAWGGPPSFTHDGSEAAPCHLAPIKGAPMCRQRKNVPGSSQGVFSIETQAPGAPRACFSMRKRPRECFSTNEKSSKSSAGEGGDPEDLCGRTKLSGAISERLSQLRVWENLL